MRVENPKQRQEKKTWPYTITIHWYLLEVGAVHARCARVVLLLRLPHVGDAMGAEERPRITVTPSLHGLHLGRLPLVQLDAPHEGDMHTHVAVHRRAVIADEDAVRRRGPGRVARRAVKANLFISKHVHIYVRKEKAQKERKV